MFIQYYSFIYNCYYNVFCFDIGYNHKNKHNEAEYLMTTTKGNQ